MSFWNVNIAGGCLVARWNLDSGALLGSKFDGVCTSKNTLFSSQVMDDTSAC